MVERIARAPQAEIKQKKKRIARLFSSPCSDGLCQPIAILEQSVIFLGCLLSWTDWEFESVQTQYLVRQPRGGRRARWVKILQPIAASEPGDKLREPLVPLLA
jgi:hypothetical protein